MRQVGLAGLISSPQPSVLPPSELSSTGKASFARQR